MPETRPRGWHRRAHSALRRSLRLRLIIVFLLLALGLSVIFLFATQRAIGAGWRLAVAPLVSDYVDRLVADVGSPPSIAKATALTARLPISIRIEGPQVQWRSHPRQDERDWDRGEGRWHEESPRLLERETADGHRISLGLGDLSWRSQPRLFGAFSLFMLLGVILLAYAYVRRLLRPLDDIRVGVRRFGSGAFEQPIVVRRRDELGDLAAQINTMATDLQRMLDGKRALLLAISHELRSPLTRARLNAELLPESGATEKPRTALLRDLAEMRDLINDLLESERLADPHAALSREPVVLRDLLDALVQGRPDWREVRIDLPADLAPLSADPLRLRLALRNLLDNAMRHGAGGAAPEVAARRLGKDIEITVRDFGPGVEAGHLSRLAEPFYRTDQARQRITGGVGLGLYLARLVAEAHGGSLSFRNAQPGLAVSLLLPAPQ